MGYITGCRQQVNRQALAFSSAIATAMTTPSDSAITHALPSRNEDASTTHLLYADILDQYVLRKAILLEGLDAPPAQSIPFAVGHLPDARSVAFYFNAMPAAQSSVAQEAQISHFSTIMSHTELPNLAELRIGFLSPCAVGKPQDQRPRPFSALDTLRLPALKSLALHGVLCNSTSAFPSSLVTLSLVDCEPDIAADTEMLLDVLGKLSLLRQLRIANFRSPSQAFRSKPEADGRTVKLDHLEVLSLQDDLSFLNGTLPRLVFPTTTSISLESLRAPVEDIPALADTLSARYGQPDDKFDIMDLTVIPNKPFFDLRASKRSSPGTTLHVRLTTFLTGRGQLNAYKGLRDFLEHLPALHPVTRLSIASSDVLIDASDSQGGITPRGGGTDCSFDSDSDSDIDVSESTRFIDLSLLGDALLPLQAVRELYVRGEINWHFWNILQLPRNLSRELAIFKHLSVLTITDLNVAKNVDCIVDRLTLCVQWRRGTLTKIAFESCSQPEGEAAERLRKGLASANGRKTCQAPQALISRHKATIRPTRATRPINR